MLWLIRFIGLVSHAIFLEFVHIFGLVVFLVAVAVGFFRARFWIVPIIAVVCGSVAFYYVDLSGLTGVLDKAASASERGAFVIVVYFAITTIGYLIGAVGRYYFSRVRPKKA
jgi:hypothetical protein